MAADLQALKQSVDKCQTTAQDGLDIADQQVTLVEVRHQWPVADAEADHAVVAAASHVVNLETAANALISAAQQAMEEAEVTTDTAALRAAKDAAKQGNDALSAAQPLANRAQELKTRLSSALLKTDAAHEVDRMTRAKDTAASLWGAAKWLFGFVGFAAPLTLAYQQTNRGSATTVAWVVIAVLAAILSGASTFFIGAIAASRIREPEAAVSTRTSAYSLMGVLFLVALFAIPISVGFQAAAAFRAFSQATGDRDATLGHRVGLFLKSGEELTGVTDYCKKHSADDDATDAFVTACAAFSQTPTPTADRAQALATALAK